MYNGRKLYVHSIISAMGRQLAFVYLDDTVFFSKSPREHIGIVRTVLTLLCNAGIALKLKNCHFFL